MSYQFFVPSGGQGGSLIRNGNRTQCMGWVDCTVGYYYYPLVFYSHFLSYEAYYL